MEMGIHSEGRLVEKTVVRIVMGIHSEPLMGIHSEPHLYCGHCLVQ